MWSYAKLRKRRHRKKCKSILAVFLVSWQEAKHNEVKFFGKCQNAPGCTEGLVVWGIQVHLQDKLCESSTHQASL